MAVRLHRATRTDQLADALGELLVVPLADPFATEVVVVPAKGVERWLSQRLSHLLGAAHGREDGICAGVEFRSPWSLFGALRADDEDPWAPDALTWPLLGVVDDALDEPWAAVLARHLGHGLPAEEADLQWLREVGEGTAQSREMAVRKAFGEWRAGHPSLDVAVEWKEVAGEEDASVKAEASRADVVIVAMAGDHNLDATDARHAAIFGAHKPLLVLPPDWRPPPAFAFRRVALGISRGAAASAAASPYIRSPTIGHPDSARWTRIWCFRPVSSVTRSRVIRPTVRTVS